MSSYLYWIWFYIICVLLFIAFIIVFEIQEKHNAIHNWVWIILLFVIIFFFISLFLYLYYRPEPVIVPIIEPIIENKIIIDQMEQNSCQRDLNSKKVSFSDLNPYDNYNDCYYTDKVSYKEDIFTKTKIPMCMLCPY